MKKLLTKILFRLLDENISYQNINEDKIEDWLASQHGAPGFVEYFKKRDLQILKTFGTLPEDKQYWILAGKRLELLRMAGQMKRAFEKNKNKKK